MGDQKLSAAKRARILNHYHETIGSFNNSISPKVWVDKIDYAEGNVGLFALTDFEAHQEVMLSAILLKMVDEETAEGTCDVCFKWLGSPHDVLGNLREDGLSVDEDGQMIVKCERCKILHYCSLECKQKSWESHHKAECSAFAGCGDGDSILWLTLRAINMRKNNLMDDYVWNGLKTLQSHMETITPEDPMFCHLAKMVAQTKTHHEIQLLQNMYGRIKANAMSMESLEHRNTGIICDPLGATINHSCDPNAFFLIDGQGLHIRSLRPIAKGEEITISYVGHFTDWVHRRLELSRVWYFDCTCPKCKSEAGEPYLPPPGYPEQSFREFDDWMTIMESNPGALTEIHLTRFIEQGWPITRHPVPSMFVFLANRFREEQNVAKEVIYRHKLSYQVEPSYYPPKSHPARVRGIWNLANAINRLVDSLPNVSTLEGTELGRVHLASAAAWYFKRVVQERATSHGEKSAMHTASKARLRGFESMANEHCVDLQQVLEAGVMAAGKLTAWAGCRL